MASKTEIRRKLLTYSLVSARMSEDIDPISALEPFFSPIAADLNGKTFSGAEFQAQMHTRYGLVFSRDVTEIFVSRLLQLGYLRRENTKLNWSAKDVALPPADEAETLLDRILLA